MDYEILDSNKNPIDTLKFITEPANLYLVNLDPEIFDPSPNPGTDTTNDTVLIDFIYEIDEYNADYISGFGYFDMDELRDIYITESMIPRIEKLNLQLYTGNSTYQAIETDTPLNALLRLPHGNYKLYAVSNSDSIIQFSNNLTNEDDKGFINIGTYYNESVIPADIYYGQINFSHDYDHKEFSTEMNLVTHKHIFVFKIESGIEKIMNTHITVEGYGDTFYFDDQTVSHMGAIDGNYDTYITRNYFYKIQDNMIVFLVRTLGTPTDIENPKIKIKLFVETYQGNNQSFEFPEIDFINGRQIQILQFMQDINEELLIIK